MSVSPLFVCLFVCLSPCAFPIYVSTRFCIQLGSELLVTQSEAAAAARIGNRTQNKAGVFYTMWVRALGCVCRQRTK